MYLNNPSLRSAGEQIKYTPEMLEEWIKCKEDILYFAEKYFYIVSLDKGRIIIPLREYQKRMLKALIEPPVDGKKHKIVLSGRQTGKTLISTLYLLHYILFNQEKNVAILANNERTATDILRKLKESYEGLPLWLQQGIAEAGWSKTSIKLENGCTVIAGSTSSNGIRGRSINVLLLDEYAFVPENVADDFVASVFPTISSGESSHIIMVSTPKGMNHFHNVWVKAVRNENNFKPIRIHWWEVPGRTEEWKQKMIADIGLIKWNQEFECKFLGSASTLIESELLEKLSFEIENPIEIKYNGAMKIYEKPITGETYIAGVDSAFGNGGDFSVVQVFKINSKQDIEQVAVYESNTTPYSKFSEIVIGISEYYNKCFLMIENNDVGGQVANMIWYDYEYDYIVNTDKKNIGTRSTRKSKLAANLLLKRYIESGYLSIKDDETIKQLTQYEEVTPNVYRAPQNTHDDHVTSMLWALYFTTTQYFEGDEVISKNISDSFKLKQEQEYDDAGLVFFDNKPRNSDGFDWGGFDL